MIVTGKSGTSYAVRSLKDEKVPKMKGDKYETKKVKVNGETLEFRYDPKRNTGLYTKFNKKNLYFVDRGLLDESSVQITEREKKEKPAKAAKAPKAEGKAKTNGKAAGKGKGKPATKVVPAIEGA